MISISTLLDPRYVFLIYAPILFALNKRVGHRTIIALTLTEWANQILKWLLAGERPYWYAQERAQELFIATQSVNLTTGIDSYDMASLINAASGDNNNNIPVTTTTVAQLKQFPVTCELGAGSPSGHAMVTATVWYILIDAYLKNELPIFKRVQYSESSEQQQQHSLASALTKLSWSIYALILVLVSLSRVYLACHFPHQCLCGAILGLLVARFVAEKVPMDQLNKSHFALATGAMFVSVLGTYFALRSMGVNPLWSVDKGMRWCVKKEYIHLDTTPFFSMMRYTGFCLGTGLAYNGQKIINSSQKTTITSSSSSSSIQHLLSQRTLTAVSSILFGQFLLALPYPKSNLNLFYLISFLMYTFFAYSIASPIPARVKRALKSMSGSKSIKCN